MNSQVDRYFTAGCGRCPLGGTPDCKVNLWVPELMALRRILLDSPLQETVKWGVPCYTLQNRNVALISGLKEYCALGFFKGALLRDPQGLLSRPGEHTQASRLIRFTRLEEILGLEPVLKAYLLEAIEVEKAGLKVPAQPNALPAMPEEFRKRLEQDPGLKSAFFALTPGRQRGYLIYFSSAKQSSTREFRIEKCVAPILEGKGLHDEYRGGGRKGR